MACLSSSHTHVAPGSAHSPVAAIAMKTSSATFASISAKIWTVACLFSARTPALFTCVSQPFLHTHVSVLIAHAAVTAIAVVTFSATKTYSSTEIRTLACFFLHTTASSLSLHVPTLENVHILLDRHLERATFASTSCSCCVGILEGIA